MPWENSSFEEPGDELNDDEYPQQEYDDDSTETVLCGNCGAEIYEEAVQCPECGTYVTADNSVWSGRPTWWIVLALLGVVAVILVFGGLV